MDAPGSTAEQEIERRLKWRCRRGTKELDVLLERYASGALAAAGEAERAALVQLLELPDPLLTEYLLGWAEPAEPDLLDLVRCIRALPPLGALPAGSRGAAQASSLKDPC